MGDAAPGNFNIPQAGRAETHVFEAGLPARTVNGTTESAGSNPAAPTTTQEGTITFDSPDGVSKIELGSHLLTGTPQPFTDGTGTLTAWFTYDPTTGRGEIHYRYTLLDNTAGDPSSVSFAVVVTDADGDRSTGGDLVIKIEDDTPTAVADTDTVAAGQTVAETGNVLSDDVQGADGGLSVVGVVLGPSATPVSGGVGAEITGNFGALTLNADGTYSYAHNGRPGGGTDTFTYTMQDADGSQSTTTLTITVENSSPGGINIPQAGRAETTVSEAGLPERTVNGTTKSAGSNPAAPTTTQDGTITFDPPDGVSKVELGGHILTGTPQPFTDPTGSLTAWFTYDLATGRGEIHYRYTLLDNTAGNPSSVSFAVAVTDVDGDRTAGGNLVINVVDDAPVANADTDTVVAGQSADETGNVLTGAGTTSGVVDVLGADGPAAGGAVVGIAAGDTGVDRIGGVGAILGTFGILQVSADGSYSYTRLPGIPGDNDGSAAGHDIFTYTIRDADGSLSHNTLRSGVGLAPGSQTVVFEAGLGPRPGSSTGSHFGDPAFPITASGTFLVSSMDGVSGVSFGGHVLGLAPGTFSDIRPDQSSILPCHRESYLHGTPMILQPASSGSTTATLSAALPLAITRASLLM